MKNVELGIVNKFLSDDRIDLSIHELNEAHHTVITAFSEIPEVGKWIFNDMLSTEIHAIVEHIGQKDFNFHRLRKEIDKRIKTFMKKNGNFVDFATKT